jgi:hypothetical protein
MPLHGLPETLAKSQRAWAPDWATRSVAAHLPSVTSDPGDPGREARSAEIAGTSARVWLWEEHWMCQLDAARLQCGMISPTHPAVPVSVSLVGSSSLRHWLVRDMAAMAGAGAVMVAPR